MDKKRFVKKIYQYYGLVYDVYKDDMYYFENIDSSLFKFKITKHGHAYDLHCITEDDNHLMGVSSEKDYKFFFSCIVKFLAKKLEGYITQETL